MTQHDEQAEPDEQVPAEEAHTPSGDAQATPEPNVEREEPLGDDAPTSEEPAAEGDPTADDAVTDGLRDALGTMRGEADRIATLETGEEQVEASEKFAADAGTLDEQIGAASRADDDD